MLIYMLLGLGLYASAETNMCLESASCPSSKPFVLSIDPNLSPETNAILGELSACRNQFVSGGGANLSRKKECLSSLYECAKSGGAAVGGALLTAGRTFGCLNTLNFRCQSQMADGLREVPAVINKIRNLREGLPPEKRRALMCGMAGQLGPDVVLGLIGGYGAAKLGPQILALLNRLEKLKDILASEKISAETVQGLFSLSDKTAEKLTKMDSPEIEKVMRLCMVR